MRCLRRNMRPFMYAEYTGSEELVDLTGNFTGERAPLYGEKIAAAGNISPASGRTDVRAFGTELNYDRVIVMERVPDGLTEDSGVWIDDLEAESPDYVVRRIAKSINGVEIAVARVYVE